MIRRLSFAVKASGASRHKFGRISVSSYFHFSSLHTMPSPAVTAAKAALASVDLSSYDAEQSRLMDERCILVDEEDNAIGAMDKKTCMKITFITIGQVYSPRSKAT
jgi:hypothetical protein